MTITDTIAFGILVLVVVVMFIFQPKSVWYIIVFAMGWTLHQITRPVDWLFRRYWP